MQQSQTVSLQRESKDENFVIHLQAMDHLELLMRRLYDALPMEERIRLKDNGTVAIGLVTIKGGDLNQPEYVYTTNNNVASPEFRKAAESIGLRQYWGDAGIVGKRETPPTQHPPTGGVPPGMGGINHAEQLMAGYAEDHGRIIHGMVVSRRLCHDCPLVIQKLKGGRIMVSVIPDLASLPSPRAKRSWQGKSPQQPPPPQLPSPPKRGGKGSASASVNSIDTASKADPTRPQPTVPRSGGRTSVRSDSTPGKIDPKAGPTLPEPPVSSGGNPQSTC